MAAASTLTIASFAALVLAVAIILTLGFRRAGWPPLAMVAVPLVYLVLPTLLAKSGLLDRYDPPPAPALLLLLMLSVLTVVIVFSRLGTSLATRVSLGAVVLLQAFRIAVELLLHRLYLEGVVPVQMSYSGRNFDIVTGITGLVLGLWLLKGGRPPRALLLGWNVLGLALLVNIVGVAALSTPVSFRVFTEGPPNLVPSTLPWIWLPSFLVQVALGSHLLVFRMLSRSFPEPPPPNG